MTIPEAAVKAANKAVYRSFKGLIRPALVQVVLEAAAPHLMAQAWQEGADSALDALNSHIKREPYKLVNPYRKEAK